MICYKGLKFVNEVGTSWTAIKHVSGDDWEFLSHKNKTVIYNYKSFCKITHLLILKWKVIHNFNGYLNKL